MYSKDVKRTVWRFERWAPIGPVESAVTTHLGARGFRGTGVTDR
jgi:hypothetical protein